MIWTENNGTKEDIIEKKKLTDLRVIIPIFRKKSHIYRKEQEIFLITDTMCVIRFIFVVKRK